MVGRVRAFLAGRAHPILKSFPKPLPVQLLKDRENFEMRLTSTARKMLFAAILFICALSSKKILIYNEEMIVAGCFIGFIILSRKSLGNTFKVTLDGRIQAIQEELQQFLNPNEVVLLESNEQQRLLRISLRICGTVIESLPMARCAPKCEKTVQALLCRNLNVKSATLPNATSSRRIRLQDDLVTGFNFSVSERFVPGCTLKASIVELIREGLVVLRMVRVGGSLKNKEDE
uniref:ATP synthase protein MI25 n=1 Tax=Zelkova schneideriana TaxID=172643 RepID=A0A8F1SR33_9ROSA|nr:ATPase subunit 4 [Zelkova schneideriana]